MGSLRPGVRPGVQLKAVSGLVLSATLLTACDGTHAFKARTGRTSMRDGAADAYPTPAPDFVNSEPSTINRAVSDREVYINDVFELAAEQAMTETFAVPNDSFGTQVCPQRVDPKTQQTIRVEGRGLHTSTFQKVAPTPFSDTLFNDKSKRLVDLFITIDDTENVTDTVRSRVRNAVHKAVANLWGYNLRVVLGGLTGGNSAGNAIDAFSLVSGTKTLEDFQVLVDTNITKIYESRANGDERVFSSLNRLLAGSALLPSRRFSTYVFLAFSDAPNCKNADNRPSGVCSRDDDNHLYLHDSATYLQIDEETESFTFLRQKALFGAYYRQTEGRLEDQSYVCSHNETDYVEDPEDGQILKNDSQYADLSFRWEKDLYNVADTAQPSWTGDICKGTEDLSAGDWLDRLTDAAKDIADHRLALRATPDVFPGHHEYDLSVAADGTSIDTSGYRVHEDRLVILNSLPTTDVVATYFHANDFDRLSHESLLTSDPELGSVQLLWGSEGASVNCEAAASFDLLPATVVCRYSGRDVTLRNLDFLPAVAPGGTALTVTAQWYNIVPVVTSLDISASTPLHEETVAIEIAPAAASALLANATFALDPTDPTHGSYDIGTALPPGDYRISFYADGHYETACHVDGRVADSQDAYACYLPNAQGALADAGVVVDPPSSKWSCTFDRVSGNVLFGGQVPVDQTHGTAIVFGYHNVPEDKKAVTLKFAPNAQSPAVFLGTIGADESTRATLSAGEYNIVGNVLTMVGAIHPGQELTVDYVAAPPLTNCFTLSGLAVNGSDYDVRYGEIGHVEELDAELYTLEPNDGAGMRLCLADSLVQHGRQIVVGYLSEKTHTDDGSP